MTGVLLGAAAAAATTRVLASLLYGVSPADPLTFVAIGLLVAAIALLASYVPARSALRMARMTTAHPHVSGGLVEMDERGHPLISASAVDTTIADRLIYPYCQRTTHRIGRPRILLTGILLK